MLGYLCGWLTVKKESFHGIWLIKNPEEKPDFVLFYAHGEGPVMVKLVDDTPY